MSPPQRPLWQEAASFAARAHAGQLRKDKATPYVAHVSRVAMLITTLFGHDDPEVLAAAYLHDVLEDCDVDYDDVHEQFGTRVADMVAALSKDKRLIEPVREAAYDEQLAAAEWAARLIKLADVLDNLWDARSPEAQRSLLEKVERALALAADDDPLAGPRRIVEACAAEVSSRLDGR